MRRIGIAVWILLVIALFRLPAGVQAQEADGLVAEWHFDEGSGAVLHDSSGNRGEAIYGNKDRGNRLGGQQCGA